MSVRHNHGMAVVVGIGIEADKAMQTAVDDQGTGIVLLVQFLAKDTASGALRVCDVGIAPRRPEIIHVQQCICVTQVDSFPGSRRAQTSGEITKLIALLAKLGDSRLTHQKMTSADKDGLASR